VRTLHDATQKRSLSRSRFTGEKNMTRSTVHKLFGQIGGGIMHGANNAGKQRTKKKKPSEL
jgi:hypothetical protein